MLRNYPIILLLFSGCFYSCHKDKTEVVDIKGRLLQSTSNPIPVSGYTLSFYQAGSPSIPFPASSSSSMLDCVTNSDGYFDCRFTLGKSTFLFFNSSNTHLLNVSGDKNSSGSLNWNGVKPISQNLENLYLYKLVKTAILELEVDTAIRANDTLEVYSETTLGVYHKIITGLSIPAHTVTAFDTIQNKISLRYSLETQQYDGNIYLYSIHNGIKYSPYALPEVGGDEDEKRYTFYFP